jgi:NADH:flavin oxidoreductases, Old Yellow Enzyme family
MAINKLLSPVEFGALQLPNRVIMAPLTRARCRDQVPGEMQRTYYSQRAGAGLIISEATNISESARGYVFTPSIFTDAQEAGWKGVVDAVHAAGGRMALQLWHVGRVGHEMVHPDARKPVAPSAIRGEGAQSYVQFDNGSEGLQASSTPRALETKEIPEVVDEYRQGAIRAKRAGFDMVEVHAANAYLLQQFMATGSNTRSDAYGGSIENRARLPLEVVDAVVEVMGADRVGVRLSPFIEIFGLTDDEPKAMAFYMAEQLNARGLAYLHVNEPDWAGGDIKLTDEFRAAMRERFADGALIFCGHYTAERTEKLIENGIGDGAAFGRPYIANPDLVERFRVGAQLNKPDSATYYGGDEEGYTDYPFLDEQQQTGTA